MKGSFRLSTWDPILIVAQIVATQSLFYLSFSAMVGINSVFTGTHVQVARILAWSPLTMSSWADWLFFVLLLANGAIGGCVLLLVVQRARRCFDFSATCHFYHLLFVWINESFPLSFTWWFGNVASLILMSVVGEFLCMRHELEPIALQGAAIQDGSSRRPGSKPQSASDGSSKGKGKGEAMGGATSSSHGKSSISSSGDGGGEGDIAIDMNDSENDALLGRNPVSLAKASASALGAATTASSTNASSSSSAPDSLSFSIQMDDLSSGSGGKLPAVAAGVGRKGAVEGNQASANSHNIASSSQSSSTNASSLRIQLPVALLSSNPFGLSRSGSGNGSGNGGVKLKQSPLPTGPERTVRNNGDEIRDDDEDDNDDHNDGDGDGNDDNDNRNKDNDASADGIMYMPNGGGGGGGSKAAGSNANAAGASGFSFFSSGNGYEKMMRGGGGRDGRRRNNNSSIGGNNDGSGSP